MISPLKVNSPCVYFIAGGDKNRNPETPYCSGRELNPNLWPTLTTTLKLQLSMGLNFSSTLKQS